MLALAPSSTSASLSKKKNVVDSVVEGDCEFAGIRMHSRSLAMRVVNEWVHKSIEHLVVGVGVFIA